MDFIARKIDGEMYVSLDQVNKAIEEKNAEIENIKATHYAEMVDAGMRERRLRRALYNACANWAKCEERINNRDAYDASEYLPSAEDKFRKKAERWSEMERKCRAKAEQYK
jgi:multimeric flavodoxin WrbA